MKMLLFFIDGLGLGEDNPAENPAAGFLQTLTRRSFVRASAPGVFPQGILGAAQASGGVPGIPQSATGQTSLMTGTNAPAFLGYHLTAIPNEALVKLVRRRGLMKTLKEGGVSVTASNLYSPEFFRRRQGGSRNRLPVSSLVIDSSGAGFRFLEDYHQGRALFADLTNRFLQERGMDLPLITPEQAAGRMAAILEEADFVFHEYFATDTYAHKGRREDLKRALEEIDRFLILLRQLTDPRDTAILVVSDHGNAEVSTSADHNRNPVPVLLLSEDAPARERFAQVQHLHEVYDAVLDYFHVPAPS